MSNFVHIHLHTQYSILDGASKISELMEIASGLGMPAVAISDHGNMFGVKEFHNAAKEKGIKPIIGVEAYVARRGMSETSVKDDRSGDHLIILAKNYRGYRNLVKLVSLSWTEGFYYKPRIDKELLKEYHEGLIVTSACIAGEIRLNRLPGNTKTFFFFFCTLRCRDIKQATPTMTTTPWQGRIQS